MRTRSSSFNTSSAAYSVVVLPEPVGPTARTHPYGCLIARANGASASPLMPSSPRPSLLPARFMRRSTICSPCGHDLQPTRDRRLLQLRDRRELAHDAVDPGAHDHLLRLRLEVDVGGSFVDGARDERVHELDRGCTRRRAAADLVELLMLLDGLVLDQVERRPVDAVDRSVEVGRRSDGDADVEADRKPEVVGADHIRRIGDGDEDEIVLDEANGESGLAARELLGQEPGRGGIDALLPEVEVVEAVLLGEERRKLARRDPTPRGDDLPEPPAFLCERGLELLGGQDAVAEQQRAERQPCVIDAAEAQPQGRESAGSRVHAFSIGLGSEDMRAVCQRVAEARVVVDRQVVGEIERGLCVLLGVARGDDVEAAKRLARKIARLRIFPDDEGRFDRSVLDANGRVLAVSQFTLIADTAKGNRPSFSEAAPPEDAEPLYERFCEALAALGVQVARGVFGASMRVELVNDGPVTIVLDV